MRTETVPSAASVEPWLAALRASSLRLAAAVSGLSDEQLSRPSFAKGWSIAEVLSHLGSAAEICTVLVERGIVGDTTPPRREDMEPVWERWNGLTGPEQRTNWMAADDRHLRLLDSLHAAGRASVRVPYFVGPLDLQAYAGYRLSEQSVHAWDVEVGLDAKAAIPAPEVALLWERLDLVATRFRHAGTFGRLAPASIIVNRTDSHRTAALLLTSELHIYPCEAAEPTGAVTGTSEAILRLVYGRNRPERDRVIATGPVTLEDLRALFPGY
jgi:uncharacterized protein (TIGR03083 family)